MRASTKRTLSFLISLTLLLGAVTVYGLLIVPEFSEIQRLRGSIATESKVLEDQKVIIDKIKSLIEKYQGGQNLQTALSATLPTAVNIPEAISTINGLASLNKIVLSSAQVEILPLRTYPGAPDYVKSLGTARVSFQVKGTYEGLKIFVSQLETNVRIMDVKEASLLANPDARSLTNELNVVVHTYYQDEK